MKKALLTLVLLASTVSGADTITRATANLNGVTSARGFFNITVRLYQLNGVEWAKYDLKRSQITLDFVPGATVTPEALRNVMSAAGYKPGNVSIRQVERPDHYEHRLGWNRIKKPTAKNAAGRWLQLNF
jgi:hypothetical protein